MNPWAALVHLVERGIHSAADMMGSNLAGGVFALTLLVRCALIPLLLPGAISSRRWRSIHATIKPDIRTITREHRDDTSTLQRELKALHERAGIGQVDRGGLLMSLVQVPILIAFFQAVLHVSAGTALATGGLVAGLAASVLSWASTVLGDATTPRAIVWISVILPVIIATWLGLGIGLYLIAFYMGTLVQSLLMRRAPA